MAHKTFPQKLLLEIDLASDTSPIVQIVCHHLCLSEVKSCCRVSFQPEHV